MSTIFQRFPKIKDWREVAVFPVALKFTAVLMGGKFVFNERKTAFFANSQELVVLDGVSLSASSGIDELTFSKALKDFFSLNIIREGNGHPVTLAPFKFAQFSQGGLFTANFHATATSNNEENFAFELKGELDQIPELAGLAAIDVNVVTNIFRMK